MTPASGNGNGGRLGQGRTNGAPAEERPPGVDPVSVEALLAAAAERNWSLRALERAYILHTLERQGGHRGNTAEALGIDRRTLYRKLKEYAANGH